MSEPQKASEMNIIELWLLLWSKKILIIAITLTFTIVGVIAAIVWPKTYEATATVFPVTSRSGSSLSQYAGLAAMAGLNIPAGFSGNDPAETVTALLDSRLLAEKVVEDLNLVEKLNPHGFPKNMTAEQRFEATALKVKASLKTKKDIPTGVIEISMNSNSPKLAQEIANDSVKVLDKLLIDKNLTTTKKRIEGLEQQIADQKIKLSSYQNQMADFQRSTSMLDPKAQSSQVMGAYTGLIEQKMNMDLQLATAEALFSSDNPKVTLLKTQISSIEKQIDSLKNQVGTGLPSLKQAPEVLIRYQNLATQLEIATKLYAGLLADLEQAKLENDKDQVYITVLDKALLPINGKPSKGVIVIMSVVLGLFISVFLVFSMRAIEVFRRKKEVLIG